MTTFQVTVNNPKAIKLLKELVSLELITIDRTIKPTLTPLERFDAMGCRMKEYRKQNGIPEEPFTMEEIVTEVKKVRAEMYENERKD